MGQTRLPRDPTLTSQTSAVDADRRPAEALPARLAVGICRSDRRCLTDRHCQQPGPDASLYVCRRDWLSCWRELRGAPATSRGGGLAEKSCRGLYHEGLKRDGEGQCKCWGR
jgi:hypothetical protein